MDFFATNSFDSLRLMLARISLRGKGSTAVITLEVAHSAKAADTQRNSPD